MLDKVALDMFRPTRVSGSFCPIEDWSQRRGGGGRRKEGEEGGSHRRYSNLNLVTQSNSSIETPDELFSCTLLFEKNK